MNNKVRVDKNAICLHSLPYLPNICIKFEFLISQGSVATFLRWGGWCRMSFVANFIRFPVVQKFWKSIKIWQSYTEFKGGTFFETQCRELVTSVLCEIILSVLHRITVAIFIKIVDMDMASTRGQMEASFVGRSTWTRKRAMALLHLQIATDLRSV